MHGEIEAMEGLGFILWHMGAAGTPAPGEETESEDPGFLVLAQPRIRHQMVVWPCLSPPALRTLFLREVSQAPFSFNK